jgi:hypothetical protein
MAVQLNRNLAQWFAGPTPTKAAGADMCLVAIISPASIVSPSFHYLFSTGTVQTANTWNGHIPFNQTINSVMYAGQNQDLFGGAVTWGQFQLIVWQIRSGVHEIWHCPVNGTPTRVANAAAASMGAFAFSSMDIGRRKTSVTDRYFGGEIELFGYFPGQSLTSAQMRKISAGQPVDSFLTEVPGSWWYNPTGTPGAAVTSLVDLSGNGLNATLGNGAPVYAAGPTYPTRVYNLNINTNGGASPATGLIIQSIDDVQVSGSVIVTSTSVSSSTGVQIIAQSSTLTSRDPIVDGLDLVFNCPGGSGLRIGSFLGVAIQGGIVRNSSFSGQVYPSNTPHLLTLSTFTDVEVADCTFEDSFVQILLSNTDDSDVHDTIHVNPSGPAIYMKGVVDAYVTRAVCVCDGSVTQRANGIIAAVEIPPVDGGIDCQTGTFDDCIVVVSDVTKIAALAQIGGLVGNYSVPQPIEMRNIKFVIPDSVDILSEDLFIFGGAIGTVANNTWNEWISNTDNVFNNEMIQLPQGEIDYLVSNPTLVRSYLENRQVVNPFRSYKRIYSRKDGILTSYRKHLW